MLLKFFNIKTWLQKEEEKSKKKDKKKSKKDKPDREKTGDSLVVYAKPHKRFVQ